MSWPVVVTIVLLLANAFFVGAEFAAMAARRFSLSAIGKQSRLTAIMPSLTSGMLVDFMVVSSLLCDAL